MLIPKHSLNSAGVKHDHRDKVEAKLKCLQDKGTLEPVEIADWAAPNCGHATKQVWESVG